MAELFPTFCALVVNSLNNDLNLEMLIAAADAAAADAAASAAAAAVLDSIDDVGTAEESGIEAAAAVSKDCEHAAEEGKSNTSTDGEVHIAEDSTILATAYRLLEHVPLPTTMDDVYVRMHLQAAILFHLCSRIKST